MNKRFNILFLMTDHTNAQAVRAGSPCIKPNLDALAADGMRFGRCYTPNAICSPARASLMTALFPSRHGVWDCTHVHRPEWVDLPPGRFPFFSQLLADAGYLNGYVGKWHVEQSKRLENFGWHEYDVNCGEMPYKISEPLAVLPKDGYPDYVLAGVDDANAEPRHPAFEKGIQFIRRAAKSGKPFCCFVSTSEPHDPYVVPRKFWEMYDADTVPLSPTLREEPVGKPEVIERMRSVWTSLTDSDWRRVTAAYYALITFLDSEVGRILRVLRDAELYDDTIIVITSDHGDMLGGHGLATKGVATPYEEVYNIPLIVRVPGKAKGVEEGGVLVSLLDVAPTLLDFCGAANLTDAHGRSLMPILEGRADASDWRDAYGEFFGQRFMYTQRIVWHEHWKYVFSPCGVDELYDLRNDPNERRNLAGDPAHRAVLVDMCNRMWRKMKAIGDTTLFNSGYATLRTAPIGPLSAADK